jgi:hypothetical protein
MRRYITSQTDSIKQAGERYWAQIFDQKVFVGHEMARALMFGDVDEDTELTSDEIAAAVTDILRAREPEALAKCANNLES